MRRLVLTLVTLSSSFAMAAPTKEQCIAANARAQELRQAGKLREGLAELDQCIDAACPEIVRADCTERVDEIRRVMPTVVFDVKTSDGADITDARVEMDDRLLRERLDGQPIAVDPGDHTFVISARASSRTVHALVREGEKDRRVSATFDEPAAHVHVVPETHPSPLRPIGLTLGGVGLAALAIGVTTGAIAIAEHGDVARVCPNNVCPDPATLGTVSAKNADSQTLATISTIGFVASVVLLGTGVILYAIAPRAHTRVGYNALGIAF